MPSQRLLLLSGIPGTGKTEAGESLARLHGFAHLDAERHAARGVSSIEEWVALWEAFLRQARDLIQQGKDVVISWGFIPGVDNITVRALQGMGFRMMWFDGNRAAALRAFLARGTVARAAFDVQMAKLGRLDLDSFDPVPFDPFGPDGAFLSREEVAKRLAAG
jgi:hypothetical protein